MPPEESIVSIKTSGVSLTQAAIQCKNPHSNDKRTLQCPNLLLLSVISTGEQPDRNSTWTSERSFLWGLIFIRLCISLSINPTEPAPHSQLELYHLRI